MRKTIKMGIIFLTKKRKAGKIILENDKNENNEKM